MKKTLLTLFTLIPLFVLGQSFKTDENTKSSYADKPAVLLDTVATSEYSKIQLYSNALNYLTSSFKDSRNVLEMKDADLGEIAFKGSVSNRTIKTTTTKKGKTESIEEITLIHFKCKIYVKDKKYKIVLSSLETSPLSFSPDIKVTIVGEPNVSERNNRAQQVALNYIKDIAQQINKKPENDF